MTNARAASALYRAKIHAGQANSRRNAVYAELGINDTMPSSPFRGSPNMYAIVSGKVAEEKENLAAKI